MRGQLEICLEDCSNADSALCVMAQRIPLLAQTTQATHRRPRHWRQRRRLQRPPARQRCGYGDAIQSPANRRMESPI